MISMSSLIPVVVATIASGVLGAVWYSDKLFGVAWRRESGVSAVPETMEQVTKAIVTQLLQLFVMLFILSNMLELATQSAVVTERTVTAWAVVLVAAVGIGPVVWEKKSPTYYLINASYSTLVLVIGMLIITKWPWA